MTSQLPSGTEVPCSKFQVEGCDFHHERCTYDVLTEWCMPKGAHPPCRAYKSEVCAAMALCCCIIEYPQVKCDAAGSRCSWNGNLAVCQKQRLFSMVTFQFE